MNRIKKRVLPFLTLLATVERAHAQEPIDIRSDFTDGAVGWEVVDDSDSASEWVAADGGYRQNNFVGNFGPALQGGYHLGTYSFLQPTLGLSNYRFSVSITPLAASGEEVGVLFYYQDSDNYYRFSTSFSDGFSRLEKKVVGEFATLAQNARGYPAGTSLAVAVDVADGVMQVSVNGEKLFSAYDAELSRGGVAIYARDAAVFDDVVLAPATGEPTIVIAKPTDFSVLPTSTFTAAATVLNKPAAGSVRFALDGDAALCMPSAERNPGEFTATCTGPAAGPHTLTADLLDEGEVIDTHRLGALATEGNIYVTIGDSIYWGDGDLYTADSTSRDGWRRALHGFHTNLMDHLNARAPVINIVFNESVRGDQTRDVLNQRIESYLERHPDANYAIVGLGTNDARGRPIPSGLHCPTSVLDGKFKGFLKSIVEILNEAGITPIVVQVPPRFGAAVETPPFADPLGEPVNATTINEYNQVIRGEDTHPLTGYIVGPDLFQYYLGGGSNRFHLFYDNLHPGALGQQILAAQLRNVITGETELPFVVDDICVRTVAGGACATPTPYKQELLEAGDRPYVDRDYVITGDVPPELSEGRWIKTADADLVRSNSDYLSFTVHTSATVFVALDSAATAPPWIAANGFTDSELLVETSHPAVPGMTLYARDVPSGTVTLGGAAAEMTGASANYAVIVVENR
jgi:lysophospholipase L1-like esterase